MNDRLSLSRRAAPEGLVSLNEATKTFLALSPTRLRALTTTDELEMDDYRFKAMQGDGAGVLQYLTRPDFPVDCRSSRGETALLLSITRGHSEVVQLLIQHGADPDVPDASGMTAMHHAAKLDNKHIAKRMIRSLALRGAGIDEQDSRGWTPLHYAVQWGQGDEENGVVAVLLRLGAVPDLRDNDGSSPVHYCREDSWVRNELTQHSCGPLGVKLWTCTVEAILSQDPELPVCAAQLILDMSRDSSPSARARRIRSPSSSPTST